MHGGRGSSAVWLVGAVVVCVVQGGVQEGVVAGFGIVGAVRL